MASAPPLEDDDNVIRSPEVPYVGTITGGLFPGRAVLLKGMVLNSSMSETKRFFVDLCGGLLVNGDHMDNKALHFNPRFETSSGWFGGAADNSIVINSLINNKWGAEERYPNGFEAGTPFTLRILCLEGYYKIAINGKHLCDYAHRISPDQVKTVYVGGNIRVDFIEFQPGLSLDENGVTRVHPNRPHPEHKIVASLDKPLVPIHYKLENGFTQPQIMQITLTPFLSGERFTINFMESDEFLFHFRVDMPTSGGQKAAVVRNSTENNGKWLKEERNIGEFPFSKGITYDIQFTAFGNSVAVDVDGVPFVKFTYRPGDHPKKINKLTVIGDLIVHRLIHKA